MPTDNRMIIWLPGMVFPFGLVLPLVYFSSSTLQRYISEMPRRIAVKLLQMIGSLGT